MQLLAQKLCIYLRPLDLTQRAKDSQKIKIKIRKKTKTPRITDEGWKSQKQLHTYIDANPLYIHRSFIHTYVLGGHYAITKHLCEFAATTHIKSINTYFTEMFCTVKWFIVCRIKLLNFLNEKGHSFLKSKS